MHGKTFYIRKTRLLGQAQRFREHGFRDMTCRLTEKQLPAWFEGGRNLAKESGRIRHFVHHCKDKREVDLSLQRFDTHARWPCQPRLDLFLQPCATRPPFEAVEHFLLDVDGDDTTAGSHQAREGQREEAHARARFQDDHS